MKPDKSEGWLSVILYMILELAETILPIPHSSSKGAKIAWGVFWLLVLSATTYLLVSCASVSPTPGTTLETPTRRSPVSMQIGSKTISLPEDASCLVFPEPSFVGCEIPSGKYGFTKPNILAMCELHAPNPSGWSIIADDSSSRTFVGGYCFLLATGSPPNLEPLITKKAFESHKSSEVEPRDEPTPRVEHSPNAKLKIGERR